jgi:hypothetical protein
MPGFVSITLDYQVLPILWARRFAIALPWLELSIGLLLIVGLGTRVAAGLSIMLLLIFVGAIGLNLLRGHRNLDCGCSGARHQQKISGKLLLRNSCLLLLSFQVALWGPGVLALDNQLMGMTIDVILAEIILPLSLSIGGAIVFGLLIRQLARLVRLDGRQ